MKEVQLHHMDEVIESFFRTHTASHFVKDFRALFVAGLDPQSAEGQLQRQQQVAYIMRAITRLPMGPEHVTLQGPGEYTLKVPTDLTRGDIEQGARACLPWLAHSLLKPEPLTRAQWAATPLTVPEGWNPLNLKSMSRHLDRPLTAARLLQDPRRGVWEAFGHYLQSQHIGSMARSETQAGSVVMHYNDGRPCRTLRLDALDIRAGKPIKHFLRELCGMPVGLHRANALDKDHVARHFERQTNVGQAKPGRLTDHQWAQALLTTPPDWPALNLQGIASHLPLNSEVLVQSTGELMAVAAGRYLKSLGIQKVSRSEDLAGHVILEPSHGPSRSVRLDQLEATGADGAAALMHYLRDLGRTPRQGPDHGPRIHYTAVAHPVPATPRPAHAREPAPAASSRQPGPT